MGSRKTSTSASWTTLKPLTVWITTNCGKFLETGIPDCLICLPRNLYVSQKATVRTGGHGTTDWFQIGKGEHQGCILSPCLIYIESTSCQMPGWMNHKLESRLPGEISTTSDMQMIPPYCRKWRGTEEPLDGGEKGEWKSWLKTQYSKNKDHDIPSYCFMANRWGKNGNSDRLLFSWTPKSLRIVTAVMKLN